MKTLAFALVAALLGAASSTDSSFVQSAHSAVLGQYALAGLANHKASDPQLKALANQIALSSNQANAYLTKYATINGVQLENKPALQVDEQYGNLQTLSGKTFDQKFAQAMYVDAQLALGDFQSEAKEGSDPALRAFARQQAALLEKISDVAHKEGGS